MIEFPGVYFFIFMIKIIIINNYINNYILINKLNINIINKYKINYFIWLESIE